MCMIMNEKTEEFLKVLKSRRSVRAYSGRMLDRDALKKLLDAAILAPTAMHEEPWAFSLIQDRDLLKKISDLAKPILFERLHRSGRVVDASPDFDIFHGAGTLLVISSKHSGPFVDADCWLAAENLMLAACAWGIGSCVIGSALPALEIPEVKSSIGIPAEYRPIAPIILGYPQGETPATSRKPPHILSWI